MDVIIMDTWKNWDFTMYGNHRRQVIFIIQVHKTWLVALYQQRRILTAMTNMKAAYINTHDAHTQYTVHRDK